MSLTSAGASQIPVARYLNPVSGTNWEGTGVGPDIRVREGLAVQVAYRAALEDVIQRTTSSQERDEITRQIEALTKAIKPTVAVRACV